MNCSRQWPETQDFTVPYDVCWIDENTILEAGFQRMVKYKINLYTKTCTREVFVTDRNYDMTCREHGKVYVIRRRFQNITVRIDDIETNGLEIWDPTEPEGLFDLTNAVKDNRIILSVGMHSYVYNKDRVFLYKIRHRYFNEPYKDSLLTQGGFYWGTNGNKTEVINLKTNETKLVYGGVTKPYCITGAGGYVYITGYFEQQIAVYSEQGTFLDFLKIDNLGEGYLSKINAITKQNGEVFLVMAPLGRGTPPVMIYSLTL